MSAHIPFTKRPTYQFLAAVVELGFASVRPHPTFSVTIQNHQFRIWQSLTSHCDQMDFNPISEPKWPFQLISLGPELHVQQCLDAGLCINRLPAPDFSAQHILVHNLEAGQTRQKLVLVLRPQWHLLHSHTELLCVLIGLYAWTISGTIWINWVFCCRHSHAPPGSDKICLLSRRGTGLLADHHHPRIHI